MKHLKSVLSAFILVGLVATALAFTPVRVQSFCKRDFNKGAGACDVLPVQGQELSSGVLYFGKLKPVDVNNCAGQQCPNQIRIDIQP